MSEQAAEVAIIDLTNTSTDRPLRVSVMIGGAPRHVVTLEPGETTRQVTPSGAAWSFSSDAPVSAATPPPQQVSESNAGEDGDEVELDDDGSKGAGGRMT